RLETILKANKISFQALDVATDEKARMLWGRRAGKRKLPGLVRMGMVIGDLEEIEEWNEYGELQDNIGSAARTSTPSASTNATPSKPPTASTEDKPNRVGGGSETPITMAMRQAGEEAAKKAGSMKNSSATPSRVEGAEVSSETLQKLDNSAPIPPPSGTTDALSFIAPETGNSSSKSKADDAAVTSESTAASSTSSLQTETLDVPQGATSKHRGSNVSSASAEEIRNIEQSLAITEEDEPDEETEGIKHSSESTKATTIGRATDTDAAQDLPGSKTQTQPAASAEDAGQSVAD
ncbi:MAG: hypothetical protein M1830_000941, partial [Pleopsidium flavum]